MEALLALIVIVASFVAGAVYGRSAEQKAIAAIVKPLDNSAAEAVNMVSFIRARVIADFKKL